MHREVLERPETIKWADDRASSNVIPDLVLTEWEVDFAVE